jgi:hypothetical protein
MKLILFALAALLLLAVPGMAINEKQSAYLQGIGDGWNLCYLRMTDLDAYNVEVQSYNDGLNSSLNATEAASRWLAPALPLDYELPEVFR